MNQRSWGHESCICAMSTTSLATRCIITRTGLVIIIAIARRSGQLGSLKDSLVFESKWTYLSILSNRIAVPFPFTCWPNELLSFPRCLCLPSSIGWFESAYHSEQPYLLKYHGDLFIASLCKISESISRTWSSMMMISFLSNLYSCSAKCVSCCFSFFASIPIFLAMKLASSRRWSRSSSLGYWWLSSHLIIRSSLYMKSIIVLQLQFLFTTFESEP